MFKLMDIQSDHVHSNGRCPQHAESTSEQQTEISQPMKMNEHAETDRDASSESVSNDTDNEDIMPHPVSCMFEQLYFSYAYHVFKPARFLQNSIRRKLSRCYTFSI